MSTPREDSNDMATPQTKPCPESSGNGTSCPPSGEIGSSQREGGGDPLKGLRGPAETITDLQARIATLTEENRELKREKHDLVVVLGNLHDALTTLTVKSAVTHAGQVIQKHGG